MDVISRPRSSQPIPPRARKVFQGTIFSIYQWEQKQFNGSVKIFEKAKRPDTVNVLPVTGEGKIILTKQEQPGTDSFMGCAGGIIDEGEEPLTAAKRELKEETGYEANEFVLWDSVHPFSKVDWVIYSYIAKGCRKVSNLSLDAGEKISLFEVTFEEFVDLVYDDRYRDTEIAFKVMKARKNKQEFEKLRQLFRG